MNHIRKHFPVVLGLAAVLVLYSVVCASDMKEEERAAQYTRDIMEAAKNKALSEPEREQHRLSQWAEQFTPAAPVNQLAQAAQ